MLGGIFISSFTLFTALTASPREAFGSQIERKRDHRELPLVVYRNGSVHLLEMT